MFVLFLVPRSFVRPPLIMLSVDGFRVSYLKKGVSVMPNIQKLSRSPQNVNPLNPLTPNRLPGARSRPLQVWANSFLPPGSCGTTAPYMRPVYPTKTFPNLYTLATVSQV